MTPLTVEHVAEQLQSQYGLDRETALRKAQQAVGDLMGPPAVGSYAPPAPTPAGRVIEPWEHGKLEKEIEHECDKVALALGFEVVRFSHPGRTKQTPGIADRRYAHRRRQLAPWFECKQVDGVQSPDQRAFQELVEAVGETYVLGGLGDWKAWLVAHGVATLAADGTPIPTPYEE